MNSKLELRIEAVRMAVNVDGVTAQNVIAVSEEIARYILGDAVLPEVYDPTDMQDKMLKMMSHLNSMKNDGEKDKSTEQA